MSTKTFIVKTVKALARVVPVDIAFSLLRMLPRRITAKLITLVNFNTDYEVNLMSMHFKFRSGPQDDHFIDLEHDRLISWEDKTLEIWSNLSKNAHVCVDVGAYLGVYSIIGHLSGAKEVYAIEPNREVFNKLQTILRLNGLESKIHSMNLAVGEEEFQGSLLTMPHRPFSSGAHLELGARESVVYGSKFRRYKSVTLGEIDVKPLDFLLEFTKSKIDLIKIDVEGYELFVIDGAKKILREHHPVLIIEIVSEAQKILVEEKLSSFGYGSGRLIIDTRESRNFIFEHRNPT
jgi:FkbM family methyltransferase